jgi:RNA ligase (TIGR02306 family)
MRKCVIILLTKNRLVGKFKKGDFKMRKLVSIQNIKKIVPIEDADRIEMVEVLGWQCVAKKGEFKEGDKCVYFEVDAFLPVEDERFEFLKGSSYRKNEIMGEGYRIKTQKFKGQISQGLALPLSAFPELESCEIDTDVSEIVGVVKWEMPEMESNIGTVIGDKPYGIPTTDETRVQSIDELRKQLLGKKYYISTKMDGTSCTAYYINGEFGVCSRNNALKDDDKSAMWKFMKKVNLEEKLREMNTNIIIQGEFCGEGIQKNRLRLKSAEWYVFNVIRADNMKLMSLFDMLEVCAELGLKTVPIEEVEDNFNYTLVELLERAKGKYPSGLDKEGIVIRPCEPEYCKILGKSLSFKVLNNDFLVKEK